ncbi:hypothetical protein JAAARDRAFT_37492 [Jaapia argillacea MUCL 33604]|uniref:Uncharacterized protein n=1 Tax=Jaapia argillacea MUCL 33604 TaxID=933084 RepID=A0A067PNT4_9AGAM|nr:hypothetical protein JAAARDRAFT_37492 [Jaapia argillacea MUCL 33604]
MVGIAIALGSTTPVKCQALYTFNQLTDQATIAFAIINLSIRTYVYISPGDVNSGTNRLLRWLYGHRSDTSLSLWLLSSSVNDL